MEYNKNDQDLLRLVLREEENGTLENLLKEYHTVPNLITNATLEDLMHIEGMDLEKAKLLKAIHELSVILYRHNSEKKKKLNSSQKAADYLIPLISGRDTEAFMILFLDNQNNVLNHKIVAEGTINEAAVYPREVMKAAIRRNASSIMLAHNHPGGSKKPSQGDIQVTKRLKEAAETLDIKIIDHIIIAGNEYFSFAEDRLVL